MAREHDLLLSWLSTIGYASSERLRKIAECMGDAERKQWALKNHIGELGRSGHVERELNGWRVVASTLVWRSGQGELYGARDGELLENFVHCGTLAVRTIASSLSAEIWRVSGNSAEAAEVCGPLGVRFVAEGSAKLLAALPAASEALRAASLIARSNFTSGRLWRRLRADGHWDNERRVTLDLEPGLWLSPRPVPAIYLWCDDDGLVRRLEQTELRWLAHWHACRRRISMRIRHCDLLLPVWPRLPILIDRALRLAAGGEVRMLSDGVLYPGISESTAREVSRILGIKLQEEHGDE